MKPFYCAPLCITAAHWARVNGHHNKKGWLYLRRAEQLHGLAEPVIFMCGEYWKRDDFPEIVEAIQHCRAKVTQFGNALVGMGF